MILDQLDRVGDERRLQGLFAHAWTHCEGFRKAFAAQLEWGADPPAEIREEREEKGGFRADLVIGRDGDKRVVELKVWHTLSENQLGAARGGRLDVVIAPKRRLKEVRAELKGGKSSRTQVMSWQAVEALSRGTTAEVLFVGLSDWLEDGTRLGAKELPELLRISETAPKPAALQRFLSGVAEGVHDAKRFEMTGATRRRKGRCRYAGFEVVYHPGRGVHPLWVGFLWSAGRKQIVWVVQDVKEAFTGGDLPEFAVRDGQAPGLVIWRPEDGDLDVELLTAKSLAAMWTVMGRVEPGGDAG